ncbi:hypothetical protein [Sinorhizobium meliloti]|jgi:hypothetical protein|uniref:hypothetical protein n=1 Tax=Rhizobium meliloti TaxID=382 RepID=UPI0020BDE037|nr:hypothetical protein [Sinorhizobium meliloti]
MSMDRGDIVVDTIGFRIPCRSFYVRAHVTRDRPLPVVDEFVMRLLRVCGQLTISRIGDFFGFSRAEIERVIEELLAKELVVAEQEELRLSQAAAELFRSSADEQPRLVEVEAWTENIWLDLVGRTLVPRPRQRPFRNLIDVQKDSDTERSPSDAARAAFEANFRDYVARTRRIPDPDKVSIHSIASLEPDRYGSAIVSARKILIAETGKVRLDFDGLGDAPAQYRTLIQALSSTYGQLDQPRAITTGLNEFERLTGMSLRKHFRTDQIFDLSGWFAEKRTNPQEARGWIVGESYLDENIRRLLTEFETVAEPKGKANLKWLRPAGGIWGMTSDLGSALTLFRRALGLPDAPRSSGATLIAPRAAASALQKRFERLFEFGEIASTRVSSSLEIVLLGQRAAMVLLHVPIDRRETLPIGIVTSHSKVLARLASYIGSDNLRMWHYVPRSGAAPEPTSTDGMMAPTDP